MAKQNIDDIFSTYTSWKLNPSLKAKTGKVSTLVAQTSDVARDKALQLATSISNIPNATVPNEMVEAAKQAGQVLENPVVSKGIDAALPIPGASNGISNVLKSVADSKGSSFNTMLNNIIKGIADVLPFKSLLGG